MIIDQKLAAKNLPTQSLKYDERSYVDDVTGAFVPSTKDSEASAEDGSRRRRTDDWKEYGSPRNNTSLRKEATLPA